MAKHSFEFKRHVVQVYLMGESGYEYLIIKPVIPTHTQIQRWVAAFNTFEDKGLLRLRKNETYSFEFK